MRIFRDGSPRLSLAAMLLILVPAGDINLALADTASVPVTTDAQPKKDEVLSEVVVTGSRIARPESERLQPTTVITSDTLEKRAITNVVDALSELPAFGQPDNSLVGGQSGFGVGQSFANFFSLGSQRTLTLVDGRRFVPANSPSIFALTSPMMLRPNWATFPVMERSVVRETVVPSSSGMATAVTVAEALPWPRVSRPSANNTARY